MRDDPKHTLRELDAAGPGKHFNPSGIFSVPDDARCLDTAQLDELEKAFRKWVEETKRSDVHFSRKRILLIFLLIRYTGARLNEILSLDDRAAIDLDHRLVKLGKIPEGQGEAGREVYIPAVLTEELRTAFTAPHAKSFRGSFFHVDPAHVRRKFYERSESCGFPRECGNPNAIRRSRGVELLRNNLPLPVVQRILGHSTPNLAASYIDFTQEDMQELTRRAIEREGRRVSARNRFFGKVVDIREGDIQSRVELMTLGGFPIVSMITNESLKVLRLRPGSFATAEIKAPWVIVECPGTESAASAENCLEGHVSRTIRGRITAEIIVSLHDGTNVCSLVTEESCRRLALNPGDPVRVLFSAFAVIINIE